MPDSASFGFGLLMVKVSNESPPGRIGLVPKDLEMLGGSRAMRDAVADPPAPELVPLSAVEMKSLTFVCGPAVVALTLTLAVQDPPAGIFAPVVWPKARAVEPAVGAQVGEPVQVVLAEGVAATSKPDGSASVNFAPVNWAEFELVSVNVNVEVPFTATGPGAKDLDSVGWLGLPQPEKVTLSRFISAPRDVVFAPNP